jgi:hypothetical protein
VDAAGRADVIGTWSSPPSKFSVAVAGYRMVLRRLIARFLVISVIAGLILAPLVTPAVVMASEVGGMSSMSSDMPCCPDEQKSKDCQDCPLVAICVLKNAQAGPSLASAMRGAPRHPDVVFGSRRRAR